MLAQDILMHKNDVLETIGTLATLGDALPKECKDAFVFFKFISSEADEFPPLRTRTLYSEEFWRKNQTERNAFLEFYQADIEKHCIELLRFLNVNQT